MFAFRTRKHRLLTALALSFAIACSTTLIASAADAVLNDTTEFRMRLANGTIEKVTVANLKPGQVLNLRTEAGTPIVVGAHEGGYVLDIANERFEVNTPEIGEIEQHLVHQHAHGDGDADDDKRIRKVIRIKDKQVADGADGQQRKVVLVRHAGAQDGHDHEDLEIEVDGLDLIDGGVPEGKRIVVLRKLEKQHAPN